MTGVEAATAAKYAGPVLQWTWDNRTAVRKSADKVFRWLRKKSHILIVGAGGTGKSTFARSVSGGFDWLHDSPWEYKQSLVSETVRIADHRIVQLLVLPGQKHRRAREWPKVSAAIAAGKYSGVIHFDSYGYHTPAEGTVKSLTGETTKPAAMEKYLRANREDEVAVFRELAAAAKLCPNRLWLLSVIAKQDLWADSEEAAQRHYREGGSQSTPRGRGRGEGGGRLHARIRLLFPRHREYGGCVGIASGEYLFGLRPPAATQVPSRSRRGSRRPAEMGGAEMSAIADDVELAPREAVEFYLPILKEYSEKLDGICQKAHDILQSTSAYGRGSVVVSLPQVARLLDWFECLSPWIEKLIRRTATLLDHGQLGEEMELLLVLRTEELESHFRATPLLLDGLAKLFSPKDLKSVLESTRTKSLLP